MSLYSSFALCGLLLLGGRVHADAESGFQRPPASVAPQLIIAASQRQAVRVAASPYRGTPVSIILHRAAASDQTFAEGFANALRAAGLDVSLRVDNAYAPTGCPESPGLRVMYGAIRSGAVNAIAEALIRSGVLSGSLTGCRVAPDDEFTFIVSGTSS
jgi:hypothetical protein